ncbi:hypothetical protein K431DRAFT_315179 [Polychaeton citri CBS 116435]|uniref:Uncharacterized protein n=1 Tax=Polychaeton citri CBS 116435 TaxID=1314669 RepID=A0A9P4Q543_9PEZI|nr:hypothetical protein K431DRAFT_315179 [Polychaeton citri CBS 116435]
MSSTNEFWHINSSTPDNRASVLSLQILYSLAKLVKARMSSHFNAFNTFEPLLSLYQFRSKDHLATGRTTANNEVGNAALNADYDDGAVPSERQLDKLENQPTSLSSKPYLQRPKKKSVRRLLASKRLSSEPLQADPSEVAHARPSQIPKSFEDVVFYPGKDVVASQALEEDTEPAKMPGYAWIETLTKTIADLSKRPEESETTSHQARIRSQQAQLELGKPESSSVSNLSNVKVARKPAGVSVTAQAVIENGTPRKERAQKDLNDPGFIVKEGQPTVSAPQTGSHQDSLKESMWQATTLRPHQGHDADQKSSAGTKRTRPEQTEAESVSSPVYKEDGDGNNIVGNERPSKLRVRRAGKCRNLLGSGD